MDADHRASALGTACFRTNEERQVIVNASCESMPEIPDGSVQCCVTSPPYFGLRDYGVEGQIGLEPTLDAYVQRLVGVFREVRRTLRDDGTLWLNLGDSYANTSTGGGLKSKDLMGVPWRVALALQAPYHNGPTMEPGWWLRDAIVWHKPNPMPSSVSDRCTSSYEMIFMLAKSARYFADMDAVAMPSECGGKTHKTTEKSFGTQSAGAKGKPSGNQIPGTVVVLPEKANLRNVWTIATTPYSGAHFATFPLELPLRCIRIGTKPGDVVLDPFMGSGTVAEAAESIGRRWVGYEINAEYLPLIAERTRQKGLFTA
jgi:DNA modification methylase